MKENKMFYFVIIAFLLNWTFCVAQTMNGSYTVGSSGADYATISAAISDLKEGTITGDVTFIIETGTYNETMDISSVDNDGFTITFSGHTKESVIIQPTSLIATSNSGISIHGTSNVVLEKFTLKMDNISDTKVDYLQNGTRGINVSGASNITLSNVAVSNSNFVFSEETEEFIASAVSLSDVNNVSISSSQIAGAGVLIFLDDHENVTITDCEFQLGQFHIRNEQNAGTSADALTIKESTFLGPFPTGRSASAIYLQGNSSDNFSNVLIEDNSIDGVDAGGTSYGIYLNSLDQPVVRNNMIKNGFDGIFDRGCTLARIEANEIIGTSNIGLRAQNLSGCNYLNNIVSSEYSAMTIMFSSNVRVVNNTLHAAGNGTGIGFTGMSGDSFVLMNNVFSVQNSIQNEVYLDFVKASEITIDHNLYSGNAAVNTIKMVMWGGGRGPSADFASMADWQAYELEMDQNSQSFVPTFVSSDDYHITGENFRFGKYLEDVTEDIDGDTRFESVGVDVGADQNCTISCLPVEPPSISNFYPTSGPLGTSVVIFGSNFDESPSNNTVFFGSVKANVLAASSSELVVNVPPGATSQPIMVLVNGLITQSAESFKLTFESDGTIGEGSLASAKYFEVGTNPVETAFGDIDGDGRTDMVVANGDDNTISILRNTGSEIGDIDFATKLDFPVAGAPNAVKLADFDGDGRLDIAVGHYNNEHYSIFRNTSASEITLDTRQDFSTSGNTQSIAIADLDGDGLLDLVSVDKANDRVNIFENISSSGSIDFNLKTHVATGDEPVGVSITDMDQDDLPDLLVANYTGASISVIRNLGSFSFANKEDFSVDAEASSITIGDLDGDGKMDLAVVANLSIDYPNARVTIFRNTSEPGTIGLVTSKLSSPALSVSMDDINGDGKTDLMYCDIFNGLFLLKNIGSEGSIAFDAQVQVIPETYPVFVGSSDLDNDGEPDVVLNGGSFTYGSLAEVFRNLNSSTDIVSYSMPDQSEAASIDHENHVIDNILVDCSDVSSIAASFELSFGATADVLGTDGLISQTSGETTNDFTDPVSYQVTAEDGTTVQNWTVFANSNGNADSVEEEVTVCDSYDFNGETLTSSGQYQAIFSNQFACDSLVTLNLTILQSTAGFQNVEACDSYEWQGNEYSISGSYQKVLMNSVGCDSVATLNLTIREPNEVFEDLEICDSYEFDGEILTTSGQYQGLFLNQFGCDSTVNVNLTILESYDIEEDVQACGFFVFDSRDLFESGSYEATFEAENGCDSLVSINLTVTAEPGNQIQSNGGVLLAVDEQATNYQWYDCDSAEPIAGENNREMTPVKTGNYAVEVFNGDCAVMSECVEFEFVLDAELPHNKITIYPTIVQNEISIDFGQNTKEAQIEVLSLDGKTIAAAAVANRHAHKLRIKARKGIYLVKVRSENNEQMQRIIVR